MKTQTENKIIWTEAKVLEVIQEAREEGRRHAQMKLSALQQQGPKYRVFNESEPEKTIDTMLDLCGFATLKISARGKFYLLAKKLSDDRSLRFSCCCGYYGGGRLNIFDSSFRQEMSVNIAACEGQKKVLAQYGIEARIESRID